jgi:GNAT superfamily N-acetyltransferase
VKPPIRPRLPSDLDSCVAVLRRTHLHDGYPTFWPDDPDRWLTPNAAVGAWVSVAGQGDTTVVGHVALIELNRDATEYAVWRRSLGGEVTRAISLSRLFVDPDRRGHGTARALVSHAVASARDRGRLPVLDVVDTGVSAIRLYASMGWRHVATTTWHQAGGEERFLNLYVYPETKTVTAWRPAR